VSDARLVPVGDGALRIELAGGERIDSGVNARAIALAALLREAALAGVYDVVPTYRSVNVYFDPLHTDLDRIHQFTGTALQRVSQSSVIAGRLIQIAVKYGGSEGPDLGEVAAWGGLTEQEVVARHSGTDYRVFMMGFVPGFPYLGTVDRQIAMPRRDVPRRRVEAGAVGIAGQQTGIYPAATPGGWRLIGRTAARLVDFKRPQPFLVAPGDMIRFEPVPLYEEDGPKTEERLNSVEGAAIGVVKPGLFTTIQDEGRRGFQAHGVPVAGPMDPFSHRLGNALVGNSRDAATLEMTLGGPELEFEDERLVAVTGASFAVLVDEQRRSTGTPFVVPRGARLRFGERMTGARAYLAVEGGIDVPPVLGSRATHVASAMGGINGRALTAGDRLPLGHKRSVSSRRHRTASVRSALTTPARLRVLQGPDTRSFAADAFTALQASVYTVGADSDRMGFRLNGAVLPHSKYGDILSEATPPGALQVPASGQPMLLMADRQTTGGYPVLATVITADLPAAAQLAPGDAVTFAACTLREALAALIAQERALLAAAGTWA
jgi:KipI family sensor histidine kinase inhibitor